MSFQSFYCLVLTPRTFLVVSCFLYVILSFPETAFAQDTGCSKLVKKTRSVKKSSTPIPLNVTLLGLDFRITEAKLEITDTGVPLMVRFDFKFGVKRFSHYPGDILTIYFEDGSHYEFLYAVKQPDHGKVSFTLIKADDNSDKIAEEEDVLFYTKLLDVNMTSFKLQLNSPTVEMRVSKEDGILVRQTIVCLADN